MCLVRSGKRSMSAATSANDGSSGSPYSAHDISPISSIAESAMRMPSSSCKRVSKSASGTMLRKLKLGARSARVSAAVPNLRTSSALIYTCQNAALSVRP